MKGIVGVVSRLTLTIVLVTGSSTAMAGNASCTGSNSFGGSVPPGASLNANVKETNEFIARHEEVADQIRNATGSDSLATAYLSAQYGNFFLQKFARGADWDYKAIHSNPDYAGYGNYNYGVVAGLFGLSDSAAGHFAGAVHLAADFVNGTIFFTTGGSHGHPANTENFIGMFDGVLSSYDGVQDQANIARGVHASLTVWSQPGATSFPSNACALRAPLSEVINSTLLNRLANDILRTFQFLGQQGILESPEAGVLIRAYAKKVKKAIVNVGPDYNRGDDPPREDP